MAAGVSCELLHRDLTKRVIGIFYDTYNELGYGFPEFACRAAFAIALAADGLDVRQEVPLPVVFRGRRIASFRADMVINDLLIIEVKVRPHIDGADRTQMLHYLKSSGKSLGLVVNFGPHPEYKRVVFDTARNIGKAEAHGVWSETELDDPPVR